MGVTGEIVRSVFSKSRSVRTQESNVKNYGVDKRRWSSVRSYLCGEEYNPVLAEEDSASVRSSEATVTQPAKEDFTNNGDVQRNESTKEEITDEKPNSMSSLLRREDAAVVIQTAFRRFRARRRPEGRTQVLIVEAESPSRESIGTSIEVQTGNSVEVFSISTINESFDVHQKIQQKVRPQILKPKEDWDDSTVSSNVSKMRIQNRLEATTRRERALAYAFAQQLRICSNKRQARADGIEPNMGWSWLERWMATRQPECSSADDQIISKQIEPISCNQRSSVMMKFFDLGGEERESCGSNEVSVQIDNFSVTAPEVNNDFKSFKDRVKPARNVSRRKTVPSNQYPKESTKVSKKEHSRDTVKDKLQKQKQPVSKRETKSKDASSHPIA